MSASPVFKWPPHMQRQPGWCGPAITAYGVNSKFDLNITPEDIVRTAGIEDTIEDRGISPTQLVRTVKELCPNLSGMIVNSLNVNDLRVLVRIENVLVIVDWQGVFCLENYLSAGTVEQDEGHYSIVQDVYERQLKMLDPDYLYSMFIRKDLFEKRWWDTEEGNIHLAMVYFEKSETVNINSLISNNCSGEQKIVLN